MKNNSTWFRFFALPVISVLLALLAVPSLLSASAEVFNEHHVASLRSVAEAAISPDGARVAYTLRVFPRPPEEDDGRNWTELHVVRDDGVSLPFVAGKVNVSDVAWTPDGRAISFLTKRGDDKHRSLYVISIEGGEARRVLSHGADIREYSWSPDGGRVAFLASEAIPQEQTKLREKGFNQEVYEEDWKPVRVWIGEPGNDKAEHRALELPGSASELHWSPEDSRLAVALAPTSLIDDSFMRRVIHIVDVETGGIVATVEHEGKFGVVRWSPDGRRLAFIGSEDLHDTREGRLMVVSAEGGRARNLLPGYLGHIQALAWRDPETIHYVSDEGVWTTHGRIRHDGSARETLAPEGGTILAGLSLSKDGRAAAFTGQSPSHPHEVFLQKADEKPRRLTDSNPWLAKMRFAPQEVVTYQARDGLEIEGLLIRPLEEEKGNRYPLIVVVHGGPEAHYSNGWLTAYSIPGQMAAAKGFAVFYPNYRGSTGRGVDFAKTSQGDPAGKEFDDVVDGVDHLIAAGLADRDRVGITGGSYGGYASAWGATYYSDRFAASVMFVGLSELISKLGTGDIPHEMHLVHWRKWPWEDWNFFQERSPLFHIKKHATPLLILHGKEDPRVDRGQSLQLYRYLKLLNQAPVRLVLYPGEGHGNARAASRLDYSLRMMRWFEHYLSGPGGDPPPFELTYTQE